MKFFKVWVVALVAMLGLSSCEHECDWIDVDYSKELKGTWTCFTEDYAEALIIKEDGSVVSYGVEDGESWKGVKGAVEAARNKLILMFEDDDNFEGRFEIIPGEAFSIFDENGKRYTYRYCANDLADEVLGGMWVCNDASTARKNEMLIQTFATDGTVTMTGALPGTGEYVLESKKPYIVVGDLMIYDINDTDAAACQLVYSSNGTALGEILTMRDKYVSNGQVVEDVASFLRVKQTLNLAGTKYDYNSIYVSNVKGLDQDIEIFGWTFNFAKMDGVTLDKMLKHLLYTVEFPNANTFKYSCYYNNQNMAMEAPIVVEGNKMTVKLNERNAALRDVDIYAFQDKNNSQFHMYLPRYSFINFYGNMQVTILAQLGQLDTTDEAAVKAAFDTIEAAVESVNLSIVMKESK